jgi:hypothetical protein
MVPPAVDDYCLSSHLWRVLVNGVAIFFIACPRGLVGGEIVNNCMWCDAEGSKSS